MSLPKKRLGRGLDGLISGGVAVAEAPQIEIDSTRVEKNPPALGKIADNLNKLLVQTQSETDTPASAVAAPTGFIQVDLSKIVVSPYQKRKDFNEQALTELVSSIREQGLLQPIVVRALKNGQYELIAGERRYRACKKLELKQIPARIVEAANPAAAVMGLIENLQRENLNPVEEARGYGMLLGDFNMTQEQIAERTGKARATVANSLRLLLLEPEILGYLTHGQLSVGHAKVLLGIADSAQRLMAARKVIEEGLSVRQTEALLRKGPAATQAKSKRLASEEELAVVADLEKRLKATLNTKVSIAHSAKGGKMTIYYRSNAELESVLKRIGV